jgi:NhaP-type Na+/H+ or K+/H+ antiporter
MRTEGLRDRRTLTRCSIAAELPNDYQSLLVVVVVVVVAVMPNDYHMVVVVVAVVVAVMPIRLLRKSADCEEHK